ncbi:MarR family transcriptional regulator [Roseovarius sp. SCSIO 43702]|uniref:MarR family transcriptional regulator n=1 Tax=Roseovarius sp. SCSIO 43702 TaxID=2823043 RepID=UPI001C72D16D|nr:MarR family transcriptional regulator [Roseovarius sp. SCSIO 43702]QYX58139.1 MarR family transcriptional regulator [Roseovarius sp. SCSIO 43702]
MPRSAGRVFGLLLFDGDAVAFSDLARQLGMSRGSVSSSVRLLEERGVVRRLGRPGDRQDYFQFASTAFTGLLDGAMRRTMRARDQIGESLNALPEGAAGPRARLGAYLSFYDAITGGLSQARERLPCRDMIAQTEKVEEDE